MQALIHRIRLGSAAAALALGLAAAAGAAPLPAPAPADTALRCGSGPAPGALPVGYPEQTRPPAGNWHGNLANGSYNWAPAYDLQAMVYHLSATGDPAWAARIVDGADALLATRDARSPVDGQPYAWFDRSANVTQPYVWLAYAGHNLAPLMQFARMVASDRRLAHCTYRGQPLRAAAERYLVAFDRVLRAHRDELAHKDGYTYFVFARPVPVNNTRLQGAPLPVNMNADLFLAMLHSAAAESAFGRASVAAQRRAWVEEYARYLTRSVLQHRPCPTDRTCLQWRYATYMDRADDVGHANIVAKFLLDAHEDGYGVPRDDLAAFANTLDNLISPEGEFRGSLLDGTSLPGVSQAVYYEILYGAFSPSLRAKMDRLVARSGGDFAYAGSWLQALDLAGVIPTRVPATG